MRSISGRRRRSDTRTTSPPTARSTPAIRAGSASGGRVPWNATRIETASSPASTTRSISRSARIVPIVTVKETPGRPLQHVAAIGVAEPGDRDAVGEPGEVEDLAEAEGGGHRDPLGAAVADILQQRLPAQRAHDEGGVVDQQRRDAGSRRWRSASAPRPRGSRGRSRACRRSRARRGRSGSRSACAAGVCAARSPGGPRPSRRPGRQVRAIRGCRRVVPPLGRLLEGRR